MYTHVLNTPKPKERESKSPAKHCSSLINSSWDMTMQHSKLNMLFQFELLFVLFSTLVTAYIRGEALQGRRFHCYYNAGSGQMAVPNDLKALNGTCTHIYVSFASIGFGKDNLYIRTSAERELAGIFLSLKRETPWRIHASIRGATRVGITDVGSRNSQDTIFARNAVKFARYMGFDGLDIDWEFPELKSQFTQLLRALHQEIQNDARGENKLVLTAVLSGHEPTASNAYDFEELRRYLDYYHIRTYDMWGASKLNLGIHTRMDKFAGDDDVYNDWLAAYRFWSEKGPVDKMLFGFAFYGRSFKMKSEDKHHPGDEYMKESNPHEDFVGDPFSNDEPSGVLFYSSICKLIKENGWKPTYVPRAGAYYAYGQMDSSPLWQFVGYDGVKSAKVKADFIHERNMTGLFGWSLEQDDIKNACGGGAFSLARAVRAALDSRSNHSGVSKVDVDDHEITQQLLDISL